MDSKNIIGERLRLLREEGGYNQSEIAEIMKLSRMTINNYEKGKRVPDIGFAENAARFFGVTLEYLTGKSEFRNRQDMLEAVQKTDHLMSVVEKIPQIEGQQLLTALSSILERSLENDVSMPILIGLTSVIEEFSAILDCYTELEENIARSVSELRWQKVQPLLIQWTCAEKAKAINEPLFSASGNVNEALRVCSKMLSNKLLKMLENESEK